MTRTCILQHLVYSYDNTAAAAGRWLQSKAPKTFAPCCHCHPRASQLEPFLPLVEERQSSPSGESAPAPCRRQQTPRRRRTPLPAPHSPAGRPCERGRHYSRPGGGGRRMHARQSFNNRKPTYSSSILISTTVTVAAAATHGSSHTKSTGHK